MIACEHVQRDKNEVLYKYGTLTNSNSSTFRDKIKTKPFPGLSPYDSPSFIVPANRIPSCNSPDTPPSCNGPIAPPDIKYADHLGLGFDEECKSVVTDVSHVTDVSSSNWSYKSKDTSEDTDYIYYKIIHDNRESNHHPLLGMLLITISALLHAALNISVKLIMQRTPWHQMMYIRMSVTWVTTCVWLLFKYKGRISLFGPQHRRWLLLLRAGLLWISMFTCWWSFRFLRVGDGTTLAMSFPVWVIVFANFKWGHEPGQRAVSQYRLDMWGWISVFCGIVGVFLSANGVEFVQQPSFLFGVKENDDEIRRDIGIMFGAASAICAGAQFVIIHYTKRDCHWLQVEHTTAALSTFLFCPISFLAFGSFHYHQTGRFYLNFVPLSTERWFAEIALGLLGFTALALMTRGSQLDTPARTAMCLYLEIPFVYIGQCIMGNTAPSFYIFLGVMLIISSVLIPAVRKMRWANRREEEWNRISRLDDGMRKYSVDTDESMPSEGDDDETETAPLLRHHD